MPITKLTPENNYPYEQERLKALEQAVPEAFADGKVNWDTLREVLGENLEDEGRDEYFGLNWPGKREARKRAATPSRATLVPAPGEGVNEDTTENLFIEGDNLEVLKLLQKSYAGKIKMIYIDPPYNTGNDFIYNDNFTDPLEAYLDYTGARGESGELLTTNTRADGRFHSKWLNMMYPRLILARQLLREDGVIFVSIDDNEVYNLRLMMNEVFGEENFTAQMIRKTIEGGKQDTSAVHKSHEYLLVFSKDNNNSLINRKFQTDFDHYTKKDKYFEDRGPYYLKPLENRGLGYVPSLDYPIISPDGDEIFPGGIHGNNGYRWVWSKEKVQRAIEKDLIEFVDGHDGHKKVYYKVYQLADTDGNPVTRTTPIESLFLDGYTNRQSGNELRELFQDNRVFDYAKPTSFLKELISMGSSENDLILDFFAGSGSIAHALYSFNTENKQHRKFILVQLPEQCKVDSEEYRLGYSKITDIAKERIKRVIKKIETNFSEKSAQAPLFENKTSQFDLGFRVIKYTQSNFKQWKPLDEENPESLTPLFNNLSDPLIQSWKKEDLLSEILLLEGFPLTSKVTYLEDLLKNQVYRMSAPDFCAHDLFVCLDETVQSSTIELLTMAKEDIFVCLDSALSDELKARVQDKFNVHVI